MLACFQRHTQHHFRWFIVFLLFLLCVINYIDRAALSYAIPSLAHEFHLSPQTEGMILGAFGVGYSLMTFWGGVAVDYFGTRRVLGVAALFWAVALLIMGLAQSVLIIIFSRVLLGLAEGPNFPGVSRAARHWLPKKEHNLGLSIMLVAVPFALAIGGPIVSKLILWLSWRGAYFMLTAITLLWVPLWWAIFRDKPAQSSFVSAEEKGHIENLSASYEQGSIEAHDTWWSMMFNTTLMANNWSFFVFGFYLFFYMTWLPNYLSRVYDVKLYTIGLYSVFPWLLACFMMIAVGFVSDKIYVKTQNLRLSRSYPIMISQACAALCTLGIVIAHTSFTAMLFITLAVGFSMSANAAFYAVNLDVVKNNVGTALGIMDSVSASAGFIAPMITGVVVASTGHFEAVFVLMALLGLSSVVVNFLYHHRQPF